MALVGAAGFCLCGGLGVGGLFTFVSGRAKGLPTAAERARGLGLAVSVNDLKRQVPIEEDAASHVQRAQALLERLPAGTLDTNEGLVNRILSFESTPFERFRMRALIGESVPVLRELSIASRLPKRSVAEPEVRWDKRKVTPNETLNYGAQLFACQALLAAEGGDLKTVRRAIEHGRGLLPLIEAEPTYLAFQSRAWSEIRLHRALVRTVQANFDRPEAVDLLRDFLSKLGPVPSVRQAVAGDLALALDAIARRKGDDLEQMELAEVFKQMGRTDVIQIFTRTVERMPEDPEDVNAIEQAFRQMDEEAEDAPVYGGYAKDYRGILYSLKDVLTRRRLARAALMVIDGIKRGEVPTSAPADLLDPHSGKPFKLRRDADEVVVYSVGRDTLDDGGLERPPRRVGVQTRDVVFRIPLPKRR